MKWRMEHWNEGENISNNPNSNSSNKINDVQHIFENCLRNYSGSDGKNEIPKILVSNFVLKLILFMLKT